MKKVMSLLIAFVMCCSVYVLSFAEDTGIQLIGGPVSEEAGDVKLDDMKVGQIAHIEGFGDVEILSAEWKNKFSRVDEYGNLYTKYDYISGDEAECFRLNVRILNTNKKPMNYMTMIGDVICNYSDGYEFKGWKRQRNKDTDDSYAFYDVNTSYEITPLYAGRYIICVTLPNLCVDSNEPLSVTFTIGNNEFTYIHHK